MNFKDIKFNKITYFHQIGGIRFRNKSEAFYNGWIIKKYYNGIDYDDNPVLDILYKARKEDGSRKAVIFHYDLESCKSYINKRNSNPYYYCRKTYPDYKEKLIYEHKKELVLFNKKLKELDNKQKEEKNSLIERKKELIRKIEQIN